MRRRVCSFGALFVLPALGTGLVAAASPQRTAATLEPSARCVGHARGMQARCYVLESAGKPRTLWLYVPAGRSEALPLVLVLHGGGGEGAGMERLTRGGFNRIADRDGAIIAYPDGVGRRWNDGREQLARRSRESVDDVTFLRALPGAIDANFPVDPHRVYVTGISNGGLMAYRLACDAADVFAAAGAVAANMGVELAARCHPGRPIAIAVLEGTDDPIMPWQGGPVRVLWSSRGEVLSTAQTLGRWLELDQCSQLRAVGPPAEPSRSDGTSLLERTAACAQGSEVRGYTLQGAGHTWPGGLQYLPAWLVGRTSHALDANEALWGFFRAHALP